MSGIAATIAVNGINGALLVFAAILFAIAAVIAFFVRPRAYWPSFTALGLCLLALARLIH
jgi:hypothetical protein